MSKRFPAKMERLHDILRNIHKDVQHAGFKSDVAVMVELALEEAVVNIIKHGYGGTEGTIEIQSMRLPKGIKFVLIDDGVPYNPLGEDSKIDPEGKAEAHTIGGYGIYLFTKIMDEIEYIHKEGKNILSLTKFLD